MPAVRPAVVDGLFYPATPAVLRERVTALLAGARVDRSDAPNTPPKVLVAPHAGYEYCGVVAAQAYALLRSRSEPAVRRIVILGPAHRAAVRGLAAPEAQAFETPLGSVPVDEAALAALDDLPQVARSDRAHEHEHSIEVQLPFLQVLLGPCPVVPLVVGDAKADDVAQVLERLWGSEETLVIVSSDLSHYLPYEQAQGTDRATVQRILRLDHRLGPHDACGAAALNGALLVARRHGLVPRLLDLRNSGDTAGPRDVVVGYAALAFEPAPARSDGAPA